jgi:hypothetical protein
MKKELFHCWGVCEINALTHTVYNSTHVNPMQRMRCMLFNDTCLTMEATAKTFLALVKAIAISTEQA